MDVAESNASEGQNHIFVRHWQHFPVVFRLIEPNKERYMTIGGKRRNCTEHIFERGGDTLLLLGRVYFKALSAEVWLKHPDRKNGELHIFDLIFGGLSHGEQNQILDSMRGRIQKNIF